MLNDVVSSFRLILCIEKKRIVVDAEPRILVAEVPECNAIHYVSVFAEHSEQLCILVFLKHFLVISYLGCTLVEAETATHILIYTDIKFCDVDVVNEFCIFGDGCINSLRSRSIDVVVTLHSDTVDRHTGILHFLDHIADSLAFSRISVVVVVVEKKCVRISFACILESLGDELVSCNLKERGVAVRRCTRIALLVCHSLIDYVPAVNNIFVAGNDGVDVALHIGEEFFLRKKLAVLILIHP